MRNAGLEEAQAGIKTAGRNINNLRYADYTTLMVESKAELKSILMKAKEESEKIGLKLSQKVDLKYSESIFKICFGIVNKAEIDVFSGIVLLFQ